MQVACGQVPTLPIDKSSPGDVHGELVHQCVLLKELLATSKESIGFHGALDEKVWHRQHGSRNIGKDFIYTSLVYKYNYL